MNHFLINMLLPSVLAFMVAWSFWRISRDKLSLVYDLTKSDIFPSNDKNGKYFIVKIKNKGNKAIEECKVKFSFFDCDILKYSVSNKDLIENEVYDSTNYNCTISYLNPKEVIQFTLTTESVSGFYEPTIFVRAKGVNGKEESTTDNYSIKSSFAIYLLSALVAALIYFLIFQKFISIKPETLKSIKYEYLNTDSVLETSKKLILELDSIKKTYYPDRQDNIFVILNHSDLSNLFPELIKSSSEISYKNTGYFLFYNYLIDTINKEKYIEALSTFGKMNFISSNSRSVIYYLLYKIYQLEKEEDKANKALQECKSIALPVYELLIKYDKFYNVELLRKSLISYKMKL